MTRIAGARCIGAPIDTGAITIGMKLIKPDFALVDFSALYPH